MSDVEISIPRMEGLSDPAPMPIGPRRIVKFVPLPIGLCPILWRSQKRNPDGRRDILILVSKEPVASQAGDVDDAAYDALPEAPVEW